MVKSLQFLNGGEHRRLDHGTLWRLTRVCTPEQDGDANAEIVYEVNGLLENLSMLLSIIY